MQVFPIFTHSGEDLNIGTALWGLLGSEHPSDVSIFTFNLEKFIKNFFHFLIIESTMIVGKGQVILR